MNAMRALAFILIGIPMAALAINASAIYRGRAIRGIWLIGMGICQVVAALILLFWPGL